MKLRFEPLSLDLTTLDAAARAQVLAAGKAYDGLALPIEERLNKASQNPWYQPERWRVVDEAGQPRYDVWLFGADSGAVFEAGKDRVWAPIIQFGFSCGDRAAWAALAEAKEEAAARYPERQLRTFNFALDEDDI